MTEEVFSDGPATHSSFLPPTLDISIDGLSPIKSPIMIEGKSTERDNLSLLPCSNTLINPSSNCVSNTQIDPLCTQPDFNPQPNLNPSMTYQDFSFQDTSMLDISSCEELPKKYDTSGSVEGSTPFPIKQTPPPELTLPNNNNKNNHSSFASTDVQEREEVPHTTAEDKSQEKTPTHPLDQDFIPYQPPKNRSKRVNYSLPAESLPQDSLTQTFLIVRVNIPDTSSPDEPIMGIIRSLLKIILCSCENTRVIAPPHTNLPPIQDNRNLPQRNETRVLRRYIHYGRMTTNLFTGKILFEHPTQTTGLSLILSPAVKAFLEQESKGVTIEVDLEQVQL